MLRRPVRAAILLSSALFLPALRARADDPLPKAETVLDQFVEATGGKAAYEKIKNRVSKGTIEVTGAGIKGTIRETSAAPDKTVQEIDIPGQGKVNGGTDGKVVWELSEIQGARVIEGEERANKLREAQFNDEIRWREVYAKAECTAVEDVNGKPAYKVVLTPKSGKPVTMFFDKASHLMVKEITTDEGPMGELTVVAYPEDYKKVDGILLPHKLRAKVLTQELVVTFEEHKHNVDLPADAFKVPADVQALVDKKKESK
jgi:zinc protease